MFNCDGCGHCCENLHLNEAMQDMHSGNGVCHFFNAKTRRCNIYQTRPLICRVDDFFEVNLKDSIRKADYYQANREFCEIVKNTNRET